MLPKSQQPREISTFSERVADLYAEKTLELESVNKFLAGSNKLLKKL
jgi:hypothetical protein